MEFVAKCGHFSANDLNTVLQHSANLNGKQIVSHSDLKFHQFAICDISGWLLSAASNFNRHSPSRMVGRSIESGSVATFGLPLPLVSIRSERTCFQTDIRIETLISFEGAHYPKAVILYAVYFYVRFGVSYRDLEEIMAERGVLVDHATLNRWVGKYAGAIADEAHRREGPTCRSWRTDETYIRVKDKWTYLPSDRQARSNP